MIRVFPRKTSMSPSDEWAFYGPPPLYELPDVPVYVSVTFSWDHRQAMELYAAWKKRSRRVDIGGPLYGHIQDKWKRFYPGRFLKQGITITSRGCPKRCDWCRAWHYEGPFREINVAAGHIIQDNNLLACSRGHLEKVFAMLESQNSIQFKGGLDIDYLKPWHVDAFKKLRIKQLWVACDNATSLIRLDKGKELLADFPIEKRRCYVLLAHDGETITDAERRCEAVLDKGFLPFAQLFQPCHRATQRSYSKEWKDLARKWSRPAIYRSDEVEAGQKWLFDK